MAGLNQIYRVTAYQVSAAGLATIIWTGFGGTDKLDAAVLGGLTSVLPSWCLAGAIRWGGTRRADRALLAFYIGEIAKLLVTAAMFIVAVAVVKVEFAPLITVYVCASLGYWAALLRVTPNNRGRLAAWIDARS